MKAKNFKSLIHTLLLTTAICCSAYAEKSSLTETKNKLKELDTQITQLKKHLTTAQNKRGQLNQQLAETEKNISAEIKKIRELQTDMRVKESKIGQLKQQVDKLNEELSSQQQLLADHVRLRYKMGEYLPLKWLLNQDDPYAYNQLLTFHQYIMRSRQKIITNIDSTKQTLLEKSQILQQEAAELKYLQDKLTINQQTLEKTKQSNQNVIKAINEDIQSKEHRLLEQEQNKRNLAALLANLAQQNFLTTKQPFSRLRHKLPKPIKAVSWQRMNQGVTFFATEGTPVYAVYPGKVVFSDWLNGYGLLIIIDHGYGFMTLYAHNQSLFKNKGTFVHQAEQIAAVGHSGGIKQNGLYFEVRQRGKAVPPLEWLS